MAAFIRRFLIVCLAALLAGAPAFGQERDEVLDQLLGQLNQAKDETAAKLLEQAVLQAWMRSGSPTVDLLMERAENAMADNQPAVAISILSTAIELEPDFPEVWNRRATAYYLDRQYKLSLADAERVLELEPRHFAALAGIGMLQQELGDERAALDAFRRALAIHPFLPVARRAVKELELEVEQDI